MTKKKRTVITEESHEVWIIRHGNDDTPETHDTEKKVNTSPTLLVPPEFDAGRSTPPQLDSNVASEDDMNS
jgi:hypothetical protein